jgi:hypothetical protein
VRERKIKTLMWRAPAPQRLKRREADSRAHFSRDSRGH